MSTRKRKATSDLTPSNIARAKRVLAVAKKTARAAPRVYRTSGFFSGYGSRRGIEKKTIDLDTNMAFNVNGTSLTAPPAMVLLNPCAQGSDFNQRIGRRISIRSWYIRGYITNGTTPVSQPVRLMIVLDKQPNGAAATSQDILRSAATVVADTDTPNNLDNRERFRVLMDKVTTIQTNGGTTSGSADRYYFKKYKKCNIQVTYNDPNSGIGSINTNAIWIVALGLFATGSANAPTYTFASRLRFTDD